MRIMLVNQYAPPDQAPTARLLGELAEFFERRGDDVAVVCHRKQYRGHHAQRGSRLVRELKALGAIFFAAGFVALDLALFGQSGPRARMGDASARSARAGKSRAAD